MLSSPCIETMVTALEIEILDCPSVFCSSVRIFFRRQLCHTESHFGHTFINVTLTLGSLSFFTSVKIIEILFRKYCRIGTTSSCKNLRHVSLKKKTVVWFRMTTNGRKIVEVEERNTKD